LKPDKFISEISPRCGTSKNLNILRPFSKSHDREIISSISTEKAVSSKIPPISLSKPDTADIKEELSKLEKSKTLSNELKDDVLDSLVRFDGESEDTDKKDFVSVNPNVNLKLLFFDEQSPSWFE
jgi:hypothetical protein